MKALRIVKLILLGALLVILCARVHAQSVDQRTAQQIGQLVLQGNAKDAQIEQLSQVLAKSQARIKELEDKYEPKQQQPADAKQ